jgi:hypothetical protein
LKNLAVNQCRSLRRCQIGILFDSRLRFFRSAHSFKRRFRLAPSAPFSGSAFGLIIADQASSILQAPTADSHRLLHSPDPPPASLQLAPSLGRLARPSISAIQFAPVADLFGRPSELPVGSRLRSAPLEPLQIQPPTRIGCLILRLSLRLCSRLAPPASSQAILRTRTSGSSAVPVFRICPPASLRLAPSLRLLASPSARSPTRAGDQCVRLCLPARLPTCVFRLALQPHPQT